MSEKLWYKLASNILKAGGPPIPINETLIELIKTLINEDQLKFLLTFKKPLNYDQIQLKTGLDDKVLKDILNELMDIGMLTGIPSKTTGIMVYRLVAFLPGLLEFTLMKGETGPKQKKIAHLWEQLFKDNTKMTQSNYGGVINAFENAPAIDRVIPIDKTIDIQEELVLPLVKVNDIINKFDTIGISYCYCRHRKDLLDEPCKIDAPRQNCISFGRTAKFAIDHDFAKPISKGEAKEIIKEAEDLGLVHKAFHIRGDPNLEELAICNCCKCCCGNFGSFYSGAAPTSTLTSYISKIDPEICIGCGTCVEKCPMESIDLEDSFAIINNKRCIGCGICAHQCPEQAITLEKTDLRRVFILPPKLSSDVTQI